MNISRKLTAGIAGAALLIGAGGTYAATQDADGGQEAFLAAAAKRLNVSPDRLEDALQGAFFERLDADVKAGRLPQEDADRIKRRTREHGVPFIGPAPRFHFRAGPHGPGGPVFGGFGAAAEYLGLSREQLHRQLHAGSGKSLVQIARDRDKPVDGLKDAVERAMRKQLDRDVEDGPLTDAHRDRILADLDEHVDAIVDHRHGRRGRDRLRLGPGAGPGSGLPALPERLPL